MELSDDERRRILGVIHELPPRMQLQFCDPWLRSLRVPDLPPDMNEWTLEHVGALAYVLTFTRDNSVRHECMALHERFTHMRRQQPKNWILVFLFLVMLIGNQLPA